VALCAIEFKDLFDIDILGLAGGGRRKPENYDERRKYCVFSHHLFLPGPVT
jgi:hypothetical protein